ncbi:MAG: ABC transporter permease subunit [Solirubrobacterales bacterium]
MSLLRSEWIKLWSVRTTWVMLGIGLLGEALFAGLYVGLAPLEEIGDLDEVATGIGLMLVLMLVLGVLMITTEFRHGTASSTFLASPSRYPVLLAKLGLTLAVGIVAGLAYVAVNAGLAVPLLADRKGHMPSTDGLVSIYAGVVVSMALICAFGFGVGAIVRNQVGAIIAAIAFFFVLSPLPELLPGSIGDYFPAQAISSLHRNVEGNASLGQVSGGLVLAAWSLGLVAIGTLLVCRRDVSD